VPDERRVARLRAYVALALAVVGIAWSAILVRWAGVSGPASAFYRVLTAAVVLVPWRLADRRHGWPPWSVAAPALLGGVFFAFDLALWNTAVMHTQAAIASLLGNNTPIFVGLLSWMIFHRRPPASFWAGLSLSLAGCVLIAWVDLAHDSGHRSLRGDALALIACVFFASYLATTERIRTRMDTLTFSTLAIVGSVTTLWIVCIALDVPLTNYGGRTWVALIALGLVSQLAAYFALVYALGHLSATVTSVGLLAQVPGTALLAMVLLGEPLSSLQIVGAAIVLCGIYIVNRR
jgi:drug/metabolite transporter (DMT)-like permease